MTGGKGGYVGTIIGSIVMIELTTVLLGLRVPDALIQACLGLIIILLVSFNMEFKSALRRQAGSFFEIDIVAVGPDDPLTFAMMELSFFRSYSYSFESIRMLYGPKGMFFCMRQKYIINIYLLFDK